MKSALIPLLISIGLAVTARSASSAQEAPTQSATLNVKIPPQALGTALQEFARQSGLQIIFLSRTTAGLATKGLDGSYSIAAAMDRLLENSGLTYRTRGAQTIEVRVMSRSERRAVAPPAPTPASIPTRDEGEIEELQEIMVIGTAEQLVATRVATPLREIPQTISVVSSEEMRLHNDSDLGDLLSRTPGITTVRTNTIDPMYFSRGYQITTFHLDGGAAVSPRIDTAGQRAVGTIGSPDLSEYERVEVLRGSDALFGGYGDPGGTVSLVRKRPLGNFALDTSVRGGSWNSQRVELDMTGPLAREGALRGRTGAMYSHQDYFFDTATRERGKVFGSLEYDLSSTATMTVGGSFEKDDAKPFIDGLLMRSDGTSPNYPRDTSLMFDWAYFKSDMSQAYLQYRQSFDEGWNLRINAAGWRAKVKFGYGAFSTFIDAPSNLIADGAPATFASNPSNQESADATLTGTLHLFGLREEVAIGADVLRMKLGLKGSNYTVLDENIDAYAFDSTYPDPRIAQSPWNTADGQVTLDQYGVYANLRIHFNEYWSAIAGARLNGNKVGLTLFADDGSGDIAYSEEKKDFGVVTSFAGVTYSINDHVAWYASYSGMYLDERSSSLIGFEPGLGAIKGTNAETGLKGSWRNGALNATLVGYKVTQKNLQLQDPEDPLGYISGTSNSHGVDLEVSGAVSPGWRVGGGYTFNVNESETGAPLSRATPKHMLKFWTNKRLPAPLDRWSVGGSIHAQTSITATNEILCPADSEFCDQIKMTEPGYAVMGLRAGYEIDSRWGLELSVNNVFDKVYNQTLGPPFMRTWYGDPRNFTLRLDGRF